MKYKNNTNFPLYNSKITWNSIDPLDLSKIRKGDMLQNLFILNIKMSINSSENNFFSANEYDNPSIIFVPNIFFSKSLHFFKIKK